MFNYYKELRRKINRFEVKYKDRPKKFALHLAWWTILFLFKKSFTSSVSSTWYKIDEPFTAADNPAPPAVFDREWFFPPEIPKNKHIYYNIDIALKLNPAIEGLALIFFMGMGDYFFATPFIEMLRAKYPRLKLYAYASDAEDRTNSRHMALLLKTNPNFDKVIVYKGKYNSGYWKNYGYEDAKKYIPENFLGLPVVYDTDSRIHGRVWTLCQTFSLPEPDILTPPVLYAGHGLHDDFARLLELLKKNNTEVVFMQMTSRSSCYQYPHLRELVEKLLAAGYFVISTDKTGIADKNYYEVNIQKININDTVNFLRECKKEGVRVYGLSTASVSWSVSAGLKMPMLGLQHWYDTVVAGTWFPNIFIISQNRLKNIPASRQFLVPEEEAKLYYNPETIRNQYNFTTDCVLRCLKKMIEAVK